MRILSRSAELKCSRPTKLARGGVGTLVMVHVRAKLLACCKDTMCMQCNLVNLGAIHGCASDLQVAACDCSETFLWRGALAAGGCMVVELI